MPFDLQVGCLGEQLAEAVDGQVGVQPRPGGVVADEHAQVGVAALVARSGAGHPAQRNWNGGTVGDRRHRTVGQGDVGAPVGSDRFHDGPVATPDHHMLGD